MEKTSPADAADGAVNTKVRFLGETCNQINAGTPNRTDTCVEGLICIDGNMGSFCFQKCVLATECGDTGCERRLIEPGGATAMVCGLAPTECSPVSPQAGCPASRTCYLRGPVTICETSSGDRAAQDACTYSRDCLPGYTCATGMGAGYCRRVCGDAVPCANGLTCQRATGAMYGYCF